jgi:activator of HSP90 ATPase
MKTIRKTYKTDATPAEVYQALTDEKMIELWSGSKAEMDLKDNGLFSLWEGSIHGKNLKVEKNQIIQDWKEDKWDNYSKVTINILVLDNGTEIELIHEDIPDKSKEAIDQGWDEYYFGPLIELVEK